MTTLKNYKKETSYVMDTNHYPFEKITKITGTYEYVPKLNISTNKFYLICVKVNE